MKIVTDNSLIYTNERELEESSLPTIDYSEMREEIIL